MNTRDKINWAAIAISFIIIFIQSLCGVAKASLTIHSNEGVHLQIIGYNGFAKVTLFLDTLKAGIKQHAETDYKGLALLLFKQGQVYPIILGNQPLQLIISNPNVPPSFSGSDVNEYFYSLLSGAEKVPVQYDFPDLMIESKRLLDSTGSIRTVEELQVVKEKFHDFVSVNYQELYHSDMLRRLIGQYFMMHEYVDYHVLGAPDTDIRVRYHKEIMDGVGNWIDLLKHDIPEHEILNYCVSIYYDRSMVSLAYKIIENFRDVAYCPGDESQTPFLPPGLALTDADNNQTTLERVGGKKAITFISDDCPVSKVVTVVAARRFARQKDTTLIVAPLQPLSDSYLSIQRMVSGGKIMFIDDEKWRKKNVPLGMKLPKLTQVDEK